MEEFVAVVNADEAVVFHCVHRLAGELGADSGFPFPVADDAVGVHPQGARRGGWFAGKHRAAFWLAA